MCLKKLICGIANKTLDCDKVLDQSLSDMKLELKDLTKQVKDLTNEKEDYFESWKISRGKVEKAKEEIKLLRIENQGLVDTIGAPEVEAEKYWNERHPKEHITYKRREFDREYEIDVRNYFEPFDESIPRVNSESNDGTALKSLNLVHESIKYVAEKELFGLSEYWLRAYQTWKLKKGDCEDGAILMANIMLRSGIPYWRIRLNAGNVRGGGHAYVTYCRETDNQFVVLDWCYWFNRKLIKNRPLHKDEKNYYGLWFSWNQKYSFGRMETMAEMPGDFGAGI